MSAAAPVSEPIDPSLEEAPAWKNIDGTWRQVHGSFPSRGLSIEWHDFSNPETLDWGRSFHPGSLEICLNFSGQAAVGEGKAERAVGPQQVAFYTSSRDRAGGSREAGHLHRFFTLELSASFLRAQFEGVADGLRSDVLGFMENPERARPVLEVDAMAPALLSSRLHLLEPPVSPHGRALWYQSKATEILSHLLFEPEPSAELFCHRHLRLNRERCERVRFLLERDLENPPSLEMLAKEVDCSPFYLSRLFSQETGSSIPKFLRLRRVEKAGALLRAGKKSVTEVAMAVGYSSLSAFNKAFVEHWGCCPGLYPHARIPFRKTAARTS